VKADEVFEVKLSLGKGIGHPNTTEHHILWISLYFHAEGDQFIKDVGRLLLNTHGESVLGPNQGPAYAYPAVTMLLKINKSGMLYAVTYCNIHGLLESEKEIRVG
jgi:superoxide reductase